MAVSLRQLEAFVTVARTGSFSAAAQRIHVSQPALTAMIHKLEEQLRVTLFERTPRGASVTTAGRELLPTVDRLVGELNDTLSNVLSGTSPRGGIVKIACIPSVAAIFLPSLIVEFDRKYPTVRIVLRDAMPENRGIVDMVRTGEIDLGIASPLEEAPELQFRQLYDDELVALLPRKFKESQKGSITWHELAAFPLIGMAYQSMVRMLIDRTFAQIGVFKRPVAEVSLITTAVGLARAGLGVAVMPSTAVRICNVTGLKILSIVEPTVSRPIGFLYRSMAALSPPAKTFLKFVSDSGTSGNLTQH